MAGGNRAELKELFQKASIHSGSNEVLVQEIIPGDGTRQFSSCVFIKNGVVLGSMEAQRWRQHPPEFGRAATFVESIDLPVVVELTLKFLRAINYYGLAEVEYKLDPRDGQYKLLDVNARTWGFHSLGSPAGVDFSYLSVRRSSWRSSGNQSRPFGCGMDTHGHGHPD